MSKEKQIEKMAKVIEITEQIARDAHCGYPSPKMIATDLYDKGYRKQSEVERIFEEIDKIIEKYHSECYEYEDGDECDTAITYISYISCDIDDLKKKYIQ